MRLDFPLSFETQSYIDQLSSGSKHVITLRELRSLMDLIWDEMKCDSQYPQSENIQNYYQHPIWALNGLFTELDDDSRCHRQAISNWICVREDSSSVLDYGGRLAV